MTLFMKMKNGTATTRMTKRRGIKKLRRLVPRRRSAPNSLVGGRGERRSISARLVALRSLVAAGGNMKVETLFQETAKYIVLLRTQVQILQHLVERYGGGGGGR